jgi:hypothetical protein
MTLEDFELIRARFFEREPRLLSAADRNRKVRLAAKGPAKKKEGQEKLGP